MLARHGLGQGMDVPVAMPSPAARQALFHQALDGVNVHVPTPQPVTEATMEELPVDTKWQQQKTEQRKQAKVLPAKDRRQREEEIRALCRALRQELRDVLDKISKRR